MFILSLENRNKEVTQQSCVIKKKIVVIMMLLASLNVLLTFFLHLFFCMNVLNLVMYIQWFLNLARVVVIAAGLIYISLPNFPWLLKENRDTRLMYGFDFIFILAGRVRGVSLFAQVNNRDTFWRKIAVLSAAFLFILYTHFLTRQV